MLGSNRWNHDTVIQTKPPYFEDVTPDYLCLKKIICEAAVMLDANVELQDFKTVHLVMAMNYSAPGISQACNTVPHKMTFSS